MAEPPTNKRDWSADLYNQNAHFVYSNQYTTPILDLLDAQPGDRILDMGSGTGELTQELSKAVGERGLVVGVDSSEDMIKKAKSLQLQHAFLADIQSPTLMKTLAPFESFNKVFTNATLHWCKQSPATVIRNAHSILKGAGSKGMFVGEMGGFTNCIGVRGILHQVLRTRGYSKEDIAKMDPWWFPNVHELEGILQREGFRVEHISLTPRITPLPTGLKGWLETFVRQLFLAQFDDAEAASIIEEVVQMCEVDMKDSRGDWAMMYVRLRWKAFVDRN